ncbi:MAG: hypothetical protein FJX76_18875 [Armatimonadetes bacterium]|nr:hypothetical protein [Armatimonadota bacterium]
MAMNVASMNNMAMKSAMVGFVPNNNLKEVRKEEEHTTTIQDLEEQDTSNNAGKAGQENKADDAAQTRNQQAAQQARRRQISQPEVRQESTTETSESSEGSESSQTGAQQGGQSSEGRPRLMLDNTARINWEFQTSQNRAEGAQNEQPGQQAEVQKRQFLSRLKKMVNMEYQQYVKSDSNLYSRRNLREIMTALNTQDDPNVGQTARNEDNLSRNAAGTGEQPGELEGYNKFNQMKAARTLQLQHEYQQEPPQDQLSLVA